MGDLPSGTVTFLFTDIEGSTRLLHELGDAYVEVLAEHRRQLRQAFAINGGAEVDTQGDAFFYAFSRAADALAAATAGQQALAESPVSVRMGMHTGEPIVTDEGYVGLEVHRAARIMSAGHGGQVVVSESTARLVDSSRLRDLGEHRLKDLTAPQRLYQVGESEFPPLRTLDTTNLPVAASSVLGREDELNELASMLTNGSRLVTITGPGGTGKTRLALQVASDLVGRFRDGVFWVPLAHVLEPELVLPSIGEELGVRADVTLELRDRELLLLLDNLEHLLDVAPTLSALLAGAPRLRLLVTSRAPLHVAGEREYALEPLRTDVAVVLFCERARAVGCEIAPDDTVAEICQQLDGLPLALELAASRVKLLDPKTLLRRLEQRLPLLTSGPRDAPERQRTLRATIEWSYDLLDEEAKLLFARLAVFAGGCSLEAAEAICDAEINALAALADMSLLKALGDARFLMLETIREYAAERLTESGEGDTVAHRHARYFAALAEEHNEARRRLGATKEGLVSLKADQANLRSAAASAHRLAEGDLELRILCGAGDIFLRGSQREVRERVEEALALGCDDVGLRARAEALLSFTAYRQGDFSASEAAAERALALGETAGDHHAISSALSYLSNIANVEGRFQEARRLLEEAANASRMAGDGRSLAVNLVNLQDIALSAQEYERAFKLSTEAIETVRPYGEDSGLQTALLNFATACVHLDRLDEAEQNAREGLRIARELDDRTFIACALRVFAAVAVRRGEADRGSRLLGAAERIRVEIQLTLEPAEKHLHDDVIARLGQMLDQDSLESGLEAGRELSVERAIGEALNATST